MTVDEAHRFVAETVGNVTSPRWIVGARIIGISRATGAIFRFNERVATAHQAFLVPFEVVMALAAPKSKELVEAFVARQVDAVLEADVPLANHAGCIAEALKVLGHRDLL